MDTNLVTRELRQGTSLLTWQLAVHVTMPRSVLGVVRLLGRMVAFSRMATVAQALYVRKHAQPGSPACGAQEIMTRARSENSPETGVFEIF
ncbi:hypothetical protein [Sorangium sp. So ce128]|uniref:hypothetical protein n=1 Tax=Sorangium sp. So ce128 TaxID=3133281 RepID=UPI003F60F850